MYKQIFLYYQMSVRIIIWNISWHCLKISIDHQNSTLLWKIARSKGSQISNNNKNNFVLKKKIYDTQIWTKAARARIPTSDLRFTSPILWQLSYDYIQLNWFLQTILQNILKIVHLWRSDDVQKYKSWRYPYR